MAEDSPSRADSIGAGTIYSLIARLAFLFSGYAIHIGLGRALGPASYGMVTVVLSLLTISRNFIMDGPRQAISKFTAENERLAAAIRGVALRIQGTFSFAVLLVFMAGAVPLANLLNNGALAPYIRLAAPIMPIMALLSVYLASLNGLRAFGRQAAAMIVYSAGRVLLALVGAHLWGISGAILGLVAAPLGALAVARLLLPATPREGRFPARRIIDFSVPMIIFSLADTLLMYLDLLFVQAWAGQSNQVGFYGSAATVAQIPYYALLPLVDTLLPATARLLGQGQRDQARRTIATGLRYGCMLLVPAGVLISVTGQSLMSFLYSGRYAQAGIPLAILIWGQTFYAFFTVLTTLLGAEGKPRQAMGLVLAMVPVAVILNAILVPRYGPVGAACSTAATTLIGLVASLLLVQRDFGPVVGWRPLAPIVLAALVSGALAAWWRPRGLLLVPAYAVLWGADIFALWLLGGLSREDVQRLQGLSQLVRRAAA